MSNSRRMQALERTRYLILGTVGAIVLVVLGIGLWSVLRGSSGEFTEGLDYRELPTRVTDSGDRIVVVEFFSYACPHCYEFEDNLATWSANLPEDVHIERQPLGPNPSWRVLADAHFALQRIGALDEMHRAIFAGIHDRGDRSLFTADGLTRLVEGRSGRGAAFERAMRSQGVRAATAQANRIADEAGVRSVPTLLVDGRWVIESAVLGRRETLELASRLIERARTARSSAPATEPAGRE